MKKSILALTAAALLSGGLAATAQACSYSTFETNDNAYVARSMEAPDFMGEHFVVVPRGHEINGKSGNVGFVGMRHADTEWISSGLNEHGVNIESLALVESEYVKEGQGDINYLEVAGHILANAKSVDDAVEILKNTKVETTTIEVAHGLTVGMHFAIRDKDRAVVVEYVDGSGFPTVYENQVGVMTNDPAYPEQLKLAAPHIKAAAERDDEQIATFQKLNSGPDGRFSHLATINAEFKRNGIAGDVRDDGVARAFSMLNNMEITPSTMYWLWVSDAPQMVGYGNVVDINNKDYYYRTVNNPTIRKVDLDKIDFATVSYSAKDIYLEPQQFVEIN